MTAEEYIHAANECVEPEEPLVTSAMVQLYWFFRNECHLSGDESEVRVARLRNAFWTEAGISKISYRETYRDAESKGCEAVHIDKTRYPR